MQLESVQKFNAIAIKIQKTFAELKKKALNFVCNHKRMRVAKTILSK